jgi:uncharacterized membrane protein YbhN (UPF0104 family)
MRLPAWTMVSVWTAVAAAVSGLLILPRFSRSSAFAGRLARLGSEVGQSLRLMFRPLPMLLSVIVQSANVILVWLVATAIGVPVPFAYCWVLVPMVTLLTLLPVSINGMGVREGATIAFLTPLGIAAGPAVSVSFLWFLVFTAASLVGGAVYLFGRFPRPEIGPDNRTVGPIRGPDHGPIGDHPDQGRTGQRAAAA